MMMFKVFVACPYKPPPLEIYRDVFDQIAESAGFVEFQFADERIDSDDILEKIIRQITAADIVLSDITGWNPNVCLEFGLARGMSKEKLLLLLHTPRRGIFGTQITEPHVPTNLKGLGRIDYTDATDLSDQLTAYLNQEWQRNTPAVVGGLMNVVERSIMECLSRDNGLTIIEIKNKLGTETEIIRPHLNNLIGRREVEKEGKAVATRYYLFGTAPKKASEGDRAASSQKQDGAAATRSGEGAARQ